MTAPFLADALALAALGVHVLPLHHRKRFPTLPRWPDLATSDPAALEALFADGRATGVCIATGEASGVWVLDLDPQGFARLEQLELCLGRLPATMTVATRRGLHLYWRWPKGARIRTVAPAPLLGEGLDIKGARGCAAAPPTQHAAGAYCFLRGFDELADAPQWLLDRVVERPPPRRRKRATVPEREDAWAEAAFRGEVSRVARARDGQRATALFRAAAALGSICAAGLLSEARVERALLDASTLPEREALGHIANGLRVGSRTPRTRRAS